MTNDRVSPRKRPSGRYTLVIGGKPYYTGGYTRARSLYDALEAYSKLCECEHLPHFWLICGDMDPVDNLLML